METASVRRFSFADLFSTIFLLRSSFDDLSSPIFRRRSSFDDLASTISLGRERVERYGFAQPGQPLPLRQRHVQRAHSLLR
jgi:hypothetical protein